MARGAPGLRARAATSVSIGAVLMSACTGPGTGVGPAATSTSGSGSAAVSGSASALGLPSSEASTVTGAPVSCTEPLVLVTHHRAGPLDLGVADARRWAGGEGPLRVVRSVAGVVRGDHVVGVLPASRVDARVRAVRVGGVHPLRRPAAYPLQVETASCPPRRPTTLTVVGDVMLGRGVAARAGADHGRQLRPAAARLRAADLTVGNLESTLSRAGDPTQGGDSFAADPEVAGALRRAGFDVLSLANNHAGDFGPAALRQTVRRLHAAGLRTFGAGSDLTSARRPAVVDRHGTTYGFLGFNAIGETPEAGPRRTGAVSVGMPPRTGPLDRRELRRFLGDVRDLARRVDVVTVLPHWGTQYTAVPEPVQRRVARRLVAAGADLVVGGHPHWVQGAAMVDGALVVHSLGNFVFDMDFMAETMVGMVLETTWWGDRLVAAEPVPYRMDSSFTPRFVRWEDAVDVRRLMGVASGRAFDLIGR